VAALNRGHISRPDPGRNRKPDACPEVCAAARHPL